MSKGNKPTHEVLDLHYTSEEGQECFQGTLKECQDFYEEQCEGSEASIFMLKIVPIVK